MVNVKSKQVVKKSQGIRAPSKPKPAFSAAFWDDWNEVVPSVDSMMKKFRFAKLAWNRIKKEVEKKK